ncbi:hypothetical protein Q6A49_01540 [Pseudomonas sp. 22-AL-CL-001]|nr:hypothetical protein [Pseudomonas sp. 22-AL-CL-001]MDO7909215.1 hypothetical protein [Pseudomonas sp. 22-AL-CL-001]
MARLALDRASPVDWIDEVFEQNRQCQNLRKLLFSSIVEIMSLAALYAKVKRTEPALLWALVRGSVERLSRALAGLDTKPSLPGW